MSKTPRYLIDADVLFATLVATDINHKKAIILRKQTQKASIFITNTTIAETATVLARRASKVLADGFLRQFSTHGFSVIMVNRKLMTLAQNLFLKQTAKDVTFFDCLNMAVAHETDVDAILSFDRGYEKNGFRLAN